MFFQLGPSFRIVKGVAGFCHFNLELSNQAILNLDHFILMIETLCMPISLELKSCFRSFESLVMLLANAGQFFDYKFQLEFAGMLRVSACNKFIALIALALKFNLESLSS
ncbi:hypothetical protein E6O75_ATG04804 [Venturia nashicola]|uniref:Uncharacterized protein n=1 Tax=Venturia nashicola TaxID=86259 RepID=A0A4Z1PHU7_9PEZI|nr:hypothetical protein E6O75_ATG04804 [Venturia nashicola]